MAKKLSKETTVWLDVDHTTSKKLATAHAKYRAALEVAKSLRLEMESIKTAELVGKGEVPAGMVPVYGHRFGWSVAAEKVDGKLICTRADAASGAPKRSV